MIPVRERLGLKSGTTVLFLVDGDTVIVHSCPKDFFTTLPGLHEDLWPDSEGAGEGARLVGDHIPG